MAESYSLEAILSARDTNFTTTMDNAQKSMGGLSKSASGIGASVGRIAAGFGVFKAVSGTIKVLSSSIRSLGAEMNESSMAWQTFEANMEMLGKSSGEIDSTRQSLEKFAQQTIYSASDMAQTYSQMAAIGVEDTEKLVKAMGGLAASAENPQQAMKTLSQQMTQAMAKPTLSWADFKLMLEQTPAGMAEVAKEMGYALDDFVVAVQDGEIASKDFAKAVSEVGTNEHFGAMATEFKSVGQAMDGARETISNKLMPAFEMLSAIGIKAISSLTDWIDTLDFSGILGPIQSLASMFGVATDEISVMTDTIKMSSDEIQSVADNWESMTLAEKQATVQTMGQEDLSELLEMLGVDFESIPDEYTKDAFLNTHGKDALEEILWVTGKWHDLTLEEKRAVLEAQIENDEIKEAIDSMELWENTEFYSKLADINMNDNDAEQQVLDLINHYRELEGLDPIEIPVDIDTKHAQRDIKGIRKSLKQFISDIGSGAKNPFEGLVKKINKGIDSLKKIDIAKKLDSWKNKAIKGVRKALDFGENLGNALSESISKIDWESLGSVLGEGITNLWYDVSEFFSELDVKGIYNSARKLLGSIGQAITDVFEGAWDGMLLTEGALEEWNALEKFVSELSNIEFNGDFGKLWSDVQTAWDTAMASVNFEFDWNDILPDLSWDDSLISNWEMDWNAPLESLRLLWEEFKSSVKEIFSETDWFELPEISWGDWSIEWPEFDLSGFENPIPKIIEMVSGWFSNFSWPSFSWPEFSWPELNISMIELGENPLEKVKETVSGWFSNFSWPSFSWPEFNWPEFSWPEFEWPEWEWPSWGEQVPPAPEPPVPEPMTIETPDGTFTLGEVAVTATSVSVEGISELLAPAIEGVFESAKVTIAEQGTTLGTAINEALTTAFSGSSSADVSGGFTAAEPPKIDFSGMIADTQSAMQQVNQAITTGMTNVASAVRMGTVMMNVAFRSGMNQAIITAQNTANRVVMVFSNLSSRLHSAGAMAGAGFRNGLASQSSSIISTAQSIANSVSNTIQSALRIASPSKVTTYLGEMVGAGLIAGMDGMVSGVESSANRLSLATLPTTDLGSSRYGGSISGQSTSSKLDEVIDAINRGQVIMMDSGALVGETSRQMDVALGQRGSLGGRHKL